MATLRFVGLEPCRSLPVLSQKLPVDPVDSAAIRRAAGSCRNLFEDAVAILIGTSLVGLGVAIYSHGMLLTGGVTGLSLLIDYLSHIGFWVALFWLNVPFILFAWKRQGTAFVVRTFLTVGLQCLITPLTVSCIRFSAIQPVYAALLGGALTGIGLLILFRHRATLGGVSILALDLQDRFGIRAGYVMLAFDLTVLAVAAVFLPAEHIALSVLGEVATNVVLVMTHRPDRYRSLV